MTSEADSDFSHGLWSVFGSKASYHHFARSFHLFHKHDLNALSHLFTSGLGFWGAIQLATICLEGSEVMVWAYAALILVTTPLVTAVLHTAFVYGCLQLSVEQVIQYLGLTMDQIPYGSVGSCAIAIGLGFGLQDFFHYLCAEPTLLSSYIHSKPTTLVVHTFWLMPLVIDSILIRHLFVPKLFVSRNRNFFVKVASKKAVEELREWINQEVPEIAVSVCFLKNLLSLDCISWYYDSI